MSTPKSAKLLKELEASELTPSALPSEVYRVEEQKTGPVQIRSIPCLNDFIAILMFRITSDLALPGNQKFKNEGMVVGIGPGLPDNAGARVPTQLEIGDVVLFSERTIAMEINPDEGVYRDQRIVIIPERSLICKLPAVPFEIIE